jgi:hypothetical protein
MPSSFPSSVDSFSTKTDGPGQFIMAAHVNDLQNAVVAAQTYLLEVADVNAKAGINLLACSLTHDESWQGGTAFNDLADDNYGPTLWNLLSTGSAPDIAGTAGGGTDPFTRCFTCTFDAASVQAGIVQFLTAQQTRPWRGQVVSLSADVWGTNVSNIRMAVVVWTSTADTLTSDIVGTWGAGNPTLATNWAYIGTPASIAITGTRTRYSVENLTIPTNANNIGVFIWTPDVEASGDLWNVARVKLEPGAQATAFVGRDPGDELRLIERFYEKSFAITTAPADGVVNYNIMGAAANANVLQCDIPFKTRKRSAPTVTLYRGSVGATAGTWSQFVGGAWGDPTTSTGSGITTAGFYVENTKAATFTAGNAHLMQGHYVADARL